MVYRFGRFRVDDEVFRFSADGETIPLEPKTLRLLLYLVQNPGRLNRKQELLDAVWHDAAVTENVLSRSIGLLRKALEDDSRDPRFIETVPTAGYRFVMPVETEPSGAAVESGKPVATVTVSENESARGTQPVTAPSRRRWTAWLVATGVVLLAAVGGFLLVQRRSEHAIRSLAVLPLRNLSGDPSQDYFADGMTDELVTELAHIPNLRVVSRTSVTGEKNLQKPLPELARELQVDAVVEGSIVRSGERARITAQLIDARTDQHLWAQSFEGPVNDVLTLQDNVAVQIAAQTRRALHVSPPRQTVNPAAHDAYLRGRYFFHKQDLRHSVAAYQQAIDLQPNYAAAYAGYASAIEALGGFGYEGMNEVAPKALAAVQRAIQLDPNNSEAYTELGSLQTIYAYDWAAAERNLTRGIALGPNDSMAEFKYASYLDAVGRPKDAVTHMRRAVELDPLSFLMNRRLGATLYLNREYDAAITQLQRAAEMEDSPSSIDGYLSNIYEQKGERDLAVENEVQAWRGAFPQSHAEKLLVVYREHGWQAFWQARTRSLLTLPRNSCTDYLIGIDDLHRGDLDHAFASFGQAINQHCIEIAFLRVEPTLDPIRHDDRYADLLKHLHQQE